MRLRRRVPVEIPVPPGTVLEAEPWPFPHAAQWVAEEQRFMLCMRIRYAGQDVRLWPEEYEECVGPPVVSVMRFIGLLDEGEEI